MKMKKSKIFTKKEINILIEQTLEMSDENIQAYINTGKKFRDKIKKVRNDLHQKIQNSTIFELSQEYENYKQLLETLKNIQEKSENLIERLSAVTDRYDFLDRPDIVQFLEYRIINRIDTITTDISNLESIVQDLIYVCDYMKEINVNDDDEDTRNDIRY
jgi:seryl-tRNA synthetase